MTFCLLGAKVPRRFRSWERKYVGTKVPVTTAANSPSSCNMAAWCTVQWPTLRSRSAKLLYTDSGYYWDGCLSADR